MANDDADYIVNSLWTTFDLWQNNFDSFAHTLKNNDM